jgi:hypothetical protein
MPMKLNNPNTHIFDANGKEIECVYLVLQTDPEDGYDHQTIYVLTDVKEAYRRARDLNKRYGKGCVFDDDWDFIEYEMGNEEAHYYEVEEIKINDSYAEEDLDALAAGVLEDKEEEE